MKITKEQAIAKAESIMYSDYHIHAGVERKVVAKEWNGKRIYIAIYCYSLAGNYKGKYDMGYIAIDNAGDTEGEYVADKAVVNLFQ